MSGHFSLIGFSYLLLFLIPDLPWFKFKPSGYHIATARANRMLVGVDVLGKIAVGICLVFHDDLDVKVTIFGVWPMVLSILCMALYLICWLRYFRADHTLGDFYAPLGVLPIPLAILPVLSLALLAVFETNKSLGWAVLVFAIGHIGMQALYLHQLCGSNKKPKVRLPADKKWLPELKKKEHVASDENWNFEPETDDDVLMIPEKENKSPEADSVQEEIAEPAIQDQQKIPEPANNAVIQPAQNNSQPPQSNMGNGKKKKKKKHQTAAASNEKTVWRAKDQK